MSPARPPGISEQQALRDVREAMGRVIRRETGITVEIPKLLTSQQARGDDLAVRFANSVAHLGQSSGPNWFLDYSGALTPMCGDLSWTEDLSGGCGSRLIAGGTFELTDLVTTGHLAYYFDSATLAGSRGITFEAKLMVVSANVAAGSGFLMRIEDGSKSFDLYMRTADLNIAGVAAWSHDLHSAFHTVRMVTRTADVAVYFDGALVTTGAATGNSTNKRLTWGSPRARDADAALVRVLRIRAADRKP